MVRAVTINGSDVTVLIALTVAGCPMKAEITSRVVEAVSPVAGVERVKVDMTVMTPEELEQVRGKVEASSSSAFQPSTFQFGPNTRVLAITSGKGGVGKSSVTVNLAVTLANFGHDVAIIDADVYGFSIPKMLGIENEPQIVDGIIEPPQANGVRCISIGFFIDDNKPVMWRGPMLHKALEQFLTDVHWGNPDYLLIDMPPGTGDVAMSMAQLIPNAEVYVVTTPQPAAQRVAQRTGAMAQQVNLPLAGVIENMSWFSAPDGVRYEIFGSGGGAHLAKDLDISLLGQIPLAIELREGADIGSPIVNAVPDSEVAFAFGELAHAIEKVGNLRPRRVYREELKIR